MYTLSTESCYTPDAYPFLEMANNLKQCDVKGLRTEDTKTRGRLALLLMASVLDKWAESWGRLYRINSIRYTMKGTVDRRQEPEATGMSSLARKEHIHIVKLFIGPDLAKFLMSE